MSLDVMLNIITLLNTKMLLDKSYLFITATISLQVLDQVELSSFRPIGNPESLRMS